MDIIYMFAFRYMKWLLAALSLAVLTEGILLFLAPKQAIRWLESISKKAYRFIGLAEIALALVLLYLILYR